MLTMMTARSTRPSVAQPTSATSDRSPSIEALLDAADLFPSELVHVVDVANGARLEDVHGAQFTGSGARHDPRHRRWSTRDVVILIGYGQMVRERPRSCGVVFVDAERFRIISRSPARASARAT